jgi:hypothetical protein
MWGVFTIVRDKMGNMLTGLIYLTNRLTFLALNRRKRWPSYSTSTICFGIIGI